MQYIYNILAYTSMTCIYSYSTRRLEQQLQNISTKYKFRNYALSNFKTIFKINIINYNAFKPLFRLQMCTNLYSNSLYLQLHAFWRVND